MFKTSPPDLHTFEIKHSTATKSIGKMSSNENLVSESSDLRGKSSRTDVIDAKINLFTGGSGQLPIVTDAAGKLRKIRTEK